MADEFEIADRIEGSDRFAAGSPVEAVEASLVQIGSWNPRIHAFLTVCEDEALQAARDAEALLDADGPLPPLLGVPVAIKDAEVTKGIRTTFGSKLFANHVPADDTIHVQRLKAAGAIVIGKTNTPEFTLLGETTNLLGPDCASPADPARTAGGSSGGSAAAGLAELCHLPPAQTPRDRSLFPAPSAARSASSRRTAASRCGPTGTTGPVSTTSV